MSTSTAIKLVNLPNNGSAKKKRATIFLAGVGAVGGALIKQLARLNHPTLNLTVAGICNSTRVLWENGQSLRQFTPSDLRTGEPKSWDKIIEKLSVKDNDPVIFVDATGSREVAGYYSDILSAGIHIVTPSKLANTGDQATFNQLHEIAENSRVKYLYETTVGAGLPVIKSIRELLETGDEIIEISGVVSGTMTYLFDQLESGNSFSNAIVRARTLGYAEPDPRDDLSGEDVARKFLILARTCGLKIDRDQLNVESLIPSHLAAVDSSTFLESLSESDDYWSRRIHEENQNNRTLR